MPSVLLANGAAAGIPVGPRPPLQQLRVTLSRGAVSLPLAKPTWSILGEVAGLDDVEVEPVEERAPGLFGAFDQGVDIGPQDVVLPLLVRAGTFDGLRAARDQLRAVTNALLGPCRLTVARPDGYSRFVEGRARVVAPTWSQDTWSVTGWQRLALVLRRANPFWRHTLAPVVWATDADDPIMWLPFGPPMGTTTSQVLGAPNLVDFGGDAPMATQWTLDGPFTQVVATHADTGRTWTLTEAVDAGDTITLTVDEFGTRRVTRSDGTSAFTSLAAPYEVWPLPPGPSTVTVAVTGATAATRVALQVEQLWLAA